jgi:P27 family predicted phage terminase small subunit
MKGAAPRAIKRTQAGAGGRVTRLACPDTLPAGARAIWRELVPRLVATGTITAADRLGLADMTLCVWRLHQAEAEVERLGLTVQGTRGGPVRNPAAALAREYRQAVQAWAARFGLTPGDRARLRQEPAPAGPTLAELLGAMTERALAAAAEGEGDNGD